MVGRTEGLVIEGGGRKLSVDSLEIMKKHKRIRAERQNKIQKKNEKLNSEFIRARVETENRERQREIKGVK